MICDFIVIYHVHCKPPFCSVGGTIVIVMMIMIIYLYLKIFLLLFCVILFHKKLFYRAFKSQSQNQKNESKPHYKSLVLSVLHVLSDSPPISRLCAMSILAFIEYLFLVRRLFVSDALVKWLRCRVCHVDVMVIALDLKSRDFGFHYIRRDSYKV